MIRWFHHVPAAFLWAADAVIEEIGVHLDESGIAFWAFIHYPSPFYPCILSLAGMNIRTYSRMAPEP
jgi:hypothetical protein